MIKFTNFSYEKNNKTILNNINLEISKNEIVTIVGNSGSGKTTLLNQIFKRNKNVSYLLQNSEHQLFGRTVYQEIKFSNDQDKANSIAESFGFTDEMKSKSPYLLSEGWKRKLVLVNVLASSPEIVLLDEPTSNLDEKSIKELIRILKELHDDGTTIIIVTHDKGLSKKVGSRTIQLSNGEIESDTGVVK